MENALKIVPNSPVVGTARARWSIGWGYKNPVLEKKRQHAINWLRYESKRGWILDGGPCKITAMQSVHADR